MFVSKGFGSITLKLMYTEAHELKLRVYAQRNRIYIYIILN